MGNIQIQLALQLAPLSEELSVQPQKSILAWHGNLDFVRTVPLDRETTESDPETQLRLL